MHASERITEILFRCGTESGVLPPTALYNEGWMLRLVLDFFSRVDAPGHPLAFQAGATWLSECLLRSRFLARNRHDNLAEGWTHADAVIGHVELGPGGRGDVELRIPCDQFIVTEAKMFSPLSAGTSKAPDFNQAARSVACIVEVVARAGAHVNSNAQIGFIVLAPESQLQLPEFAAMVERDNISAVVGNRVRQYEGAHDIWYSTHFTSLFERITIAVIAWEKVVSDIAAIDSSYGGQLAEFYEKCKRFNALTGVAV